MKSVVLRLSWSSLLAALLLTVMTLVGGAAGCGAPTLESQQARYKIANDKLDMLAAKRPDLRAMVEKKQAEFAAELGVAQAKPGETGARAVADLCYRMEKLESELNPQAAATRPGSKLGAPQPGQPGQPGQPATTPNKLGGGTPAPTPTGANTGGSGFGTPTPAPAPTSTPTGANTGGSGFGTPTPAPAPTPTPDPGSGFGGK